MLFHQETKDGITYKLCAEQDDISVRGNALVSGDDDVDKKCEDRILARLDDGDVWAWVSVHVTAEIEGIEVEGDDYLGGCSYASYKNFIRCNDYWIDMKANAKADLLSKISDLVDAAKALAK